MQGGRLCDELREVEIVAGGGGILKEKMSFARLDAAALKMSDTECARKMMAAKELLRRRCKMESPVARGTE